MSTRDNELWSAGYDAGDIDSDETVPEMVRLAQSTGWDRFSGSDVDDSDDWDEN